MAKASAAGILGLALFSSCPLAEADSGPPVESCALETKRILAEGLTGAAVHELKALSTSDACAGDPLVAERHHLFTSVLEALVTNQPGDLARQSSAVVCVPPLVVGEVCLGDVLGDTCPTTPLTGDISLSVVVFGAATDLNGMVALGWGQKTLGAPVIHMSAAGTQLYGLYATRSAAVMEFAGVPVPAADGGGGTSCGYLQDETNQVAMTCGGWGFGTLLDWSSVVPPPDPFNIRMDAWGESVPACDE